MRPRYRAQMSLPAALVALLLVVLIDLAILGAGVAVIILVLRALGVIA